MAEPTPAEWLDALNSRFTSVTKSQWCDRRDRPGRVSESDRAALFSRRTTPRNQWLDTLWSYQEGDPPLPQVAEEYKDLFRDVLRKARSNYAPMCIAPMVDRMELQAVSTQDDHDTDGDDVAAEIMEESGFAAAFKDMLGYLFGMGESYLMIVPSKPEPTFHAMDPRRCIGIPDRDNPTRLAAALVRDYDIITKEQIAYLFLPGKKYEFRQSTGTTRWDLLKDVEPESTQVPDDLGGIPIVRFENPYGMGEYEPHIDLLDRINDTTLQRIVGFWYQALRTRAVMGDEDEDDFDEAEGLAVDPEDVKNKGIDWDTVALKTGPGSMLKFPKEFSIWESQQTDFGPFINGKLADVKEFAALTSTPLYLITPDDANGSALGAGLQREAATSKVRDRRARATPGLKLVWRIAFAMTGSEARGRKLRLHWGPIEFLTLAEQGSASSQAENTLSREDRCERIWQMSPAEIKRNQTRLDAEKLMEAANAAFTAAGPPASTSPGQGQPGSPQAPRQQSRATPAAEPGAA